MIAERYRKKEHASNSPLCLPGQVKSGLGRWTRACLLIGSITTEQFLQVVFNAVSMYANEDNAVDVPTYIDNNVGTKVIRIIQNYIGIVNRMIWRKQ